MGSRRPLGGLPVPLSSHPPLSASPQVFGICSPGSEEAVALGQEIHHLLQKGAIAVAPSTSGFCSHLFVVPKSTGDYRPVLVLSVLNRGVHTSKFRMETVWTVMAAIKQGDWLSSIDLKDAYFLVPVLRASRKLLRFTWGTQPFHFRVLCFGLSPAPQVFTRMVAPVSAVFLRQGFRLLRYLDDWLILAASEQEAFIATRSLITLCSQLGLRINWKKSSLTPTQSMTFLGLKILSPL